MKTSASRTGLKPFIQPLGAFAILAFLPTAVLAEDDACDNEQVEQLFTKCQICHETAQNADHTIGPNLFGIYERQIGSVPGFKFSKAMRTAGKDWSEENLDAFLKDPQAFLPRSKMAFSGMKRDSERKDVVCYLKTLR